MRRWEIFSCQRAVDDQTFSRPFLASERLIRAARVIFEFDRSRRASHIQHYCTVFVAGGCVRTSQLAASTPHNTQIGFAEHLVKSEKRAVNFSPGTRRPREPDSRHTMCFCQSITFPCHIRCAAQ